MAEYLEICRNYETPLSYMRGHLFKLFRPALARYTSFRDRLGSLHEKDELHRVADELCSLLQSDCNTSFSEEKEQENPPIPHYLCQPYIRPLIGENVKKTATEEQNQNEEAERPPKMVKVH